MSYNAILLILIVLLAIGQAAQLILVLIIMRYQRTTKERTISVKTIG